jgi:hypothetical protein
MKIHTHNVQCVHLIQRNNQNQILILNHLQIEYLMFYYLTILKSNAIYLLNYILELFRQMSNILRILVYHQIY